MTEHETYLRGPVVVFGTGLLGTSIGLGLSHRGLQVLLSDPSPSSLAVAVDIGAGTPLKDSPGVWPELVVVAAPPDVCAAVVADALERFPAAVVVDVSSVKGAILRELEALSARNHLDLSRYVGTHPMAGRERAGAVSARGELFNAMPWVVCPHQGSTTAAIQVAQNLALDLGGLLSRFSPEEHDEAVALVSHFPQMMSSLVAARLQEAAPHALSLAGNGLRDVTRIAASDPSMWVPIMAANAESIVGILHAVHEDLIKLIGTLDAPAAPGASLAMAKVISAGNAGQARIPGKHGGPAQPYAWLSVLVADEPGQIAQLLTEIGEIGVNLEDLRLDHSSGLNAGIVEISVLPAKRDLLIDELTVRGWKVLQ
ncbi:prephenate dehydrogenase [Psychromicrobium silvestre]|uniref:Prephenate dehydrogenase n=1 Tax=Psychromicrobium silvestre TaxID=1645614 RepID=A0A7Y9LQR4_9MICC|nr:prephenate dehydrogenase [Psychromicrobium silvestre]NYE93863.1 prephenate dehydrogenase [Psychromicrobium silvestre]